MSLAVCHLAGDFRLVRADGDAMVAAQTTYPTTITRVWSATNTQITPYNPMLPVDYYSKTVISTVTVTILEPWPAPPSAFPYTMRQTAISRSTVESRMLKTLNSPTVTYITTGTATGTSAWVLWPPRPTDMAVGARLPCQECEPQGWESDPRCENLGLDTACQGQCEKKDGLWWCYQRYYTDGQDLAMGRVCWGNSTEYAQLVEPCIATDHQVACKPCKGKDISWNSVNWDWNLG